MTYSKEQIIENLLIRSSGASKDSYMSIRCDMARDIISLLKGKARLLTLDEVKQSVGEELFLEVRTITSTEFYHSENVVKVTVDSIHKDFVAFNDPKHLTHAYSLYNRACFYGWRLWTSEPTEDEIAEAMWNG